MGTRAHLVLTADLQRVRLAAVPTVRHCDPKIQVEVLATPAPGQATPFRNVGFGEVIKS